MFLTCFKYFLFNDYFNNTFKAWYGNENNKMDEGLFIVMKEYNHSRNMIHIAI